MKKTILFFALFTSTIAFSQNALPTKYEISKDGFTDFVVAEVPGKSKEEIYTKVLEWINKTYKNPKEVLKAEVLNDYIRFEGAKSGLYCYAPLGMAVCGDVKYQIEISVKDNKYKFDVIEMQSYSQPTQYTSGGWNQLFSNNNTEFLFKKDGSVKGGFKNYVNYIPDYFNTLNDDLKKYVESGVKSEQKSDW